MASITVPAREEHHPHLRPLSILRDLPAVADLIEQCFASTMDNDGRRYVQDMRRAGKDNSFIQWANRVADSTSLPLTGYIWEEAHHIIGNVSLVPFKQGNQRLYLIANVATHPEHRRKGIARILTQRAMQHAHEKNVHNIWLQVRADNPEAIHLYETLGFKEQARRTSWQAATTSTLESLNSDITITSRHPNFWQTQHNWLSRLYPQPLSWHANWNFSPLKPGFLNWLYLMFIDLNVRQWAAVKNDTLLATLSWMPTGRGESLFAATGERSDSEALTALLLHARRDLHHSYPHIALEFPAGPFDDAIHAAGFKAQRTLIWMQATS